MSDRVLTALDQALAHAKQFGRGGRPNWDPPSPEEIRDIRRSLKLTQIEFAHRFGFDLTSVRNWEQDRAQPDRIKALFLKMIQVDAQAVDDLITKVERKESRKRAKQLEPA